MNHRESFGVVMPPLNTPEVVDLAEHFMFLRDLAAFRQRVRSMQSAPKYPPIVEDDPE